MKTLISTSLMMLFLSTISTGVFADDKAGASNYMQLSLEDLMQVQVSTISRVDEKLDLAPGSIYVYTRQEIQERGYHSLGELLQTVPGFTVFHRDLQFVVGVRGLNANDNEKVSLLINGQNVNNVNEPDFLNGPINLDNVERVEVVVGPSSLFQQGNTLAATINVITKNTNGIEVIQGVGNYVNNSSTIMAGKTWTDDKYANLSFTTEKIRGFDAWHSGPRAGDEGVDKTGELDDPSFFSVVKGKYGEWSGQIVAYRSTFPELSIDSINQNYNGRYIDQFYTAEIKNEHPFNADLTGVFDNTASYKNASRKTTDGVVPINAVQQELEQGSYSADYSLRYTGIDKNLIQAGAQSTYNDNMKDWYTFAETSGPNVNYRAPLFSRNTNAEGFYANDDIQLTNKLKFVGGARVDTNNELKGDRWFPGGQAALIYQVTDNWVSKIVYDRVVRFPSALAALDTAWIAGSPVNPFGSTSTAATHPEILSTEEWQNIIYVQKVRLALTYYHEQLNDFITWFSPFNNGGNFGGNGVEFEVKAPLTPRLDVWGNYSWNNSTLTLFDPANFGANSGSGESAHADVNGEGQIIGSAQNTANAGFDYKVMDRLNFSPILRYFSNQAAVNANGAPASYITIGDRYYLDATLTWYQAFNVKNLTLHLSGDNLTNNREPVAAQFLDTTYRPEGTSFVVSADLKF